MMLNLLFIVLLCCSLSLAHVALTFPPARFPPLDFIDSIRTDGPCGVPKISDLAVITTLEPGSQVNVTWRMGYAHQGGYRIDLLDETGSTMQVLTPQDDFTGYSDQTSTHFAVTLPDLECRGCTLRLIRQANEWGETYQFRSCADVDIVKDANIGPLNGCSGNGDITSEGGQPKCVCRAPYFGQYCHIMEDCVSDADCSDRGSCVQLDSSMEAKNRCYCRSPYFGKNCEQEFTPSDEDRNSNCFQYNFTPEMEKSTIYNPSCYKTVSLEGDDSMMYRIVGDQIEVVLTYQTGTWMALGWRPYDTTPACYDFPVPKGDNSPTNLHPMDCTDIVVGRVHGDMMSNVGDYYTRDRSTPMEDGIYGGRDSLTAAAGYRDGDRTVVMFRKPMIASEKADHSFNEGRTFIIWAKGMEPGQYSFNTKSGIDEGEASDKLFYKPNELMYHGNRNRGATIVNFVEGGFNDGNGLVVPNSEPEGEPLPTGEQTYPEGEPNTPHDDHHPWPENEPEPEPGTNESTGEPEPGAENSANWPADAPDTEPHGEPEYEPTGKGEPEPAGGHKGGSASASNSICSLLMVLMVAILVNCR